MLVLEGGVGLHRTGQLQILWLQGLGIDMDYCDIEWSALECTKIILSFGGLHPSTAVLTLLLTMKFTPFFLRDSCPR